MLHCRNALTAEPSSKPPRVPAPVTVEGIPPGRYLVVAVLPSGAFHEVHRLVPKKDQGGGSYRHDSWRGDDGMS